MVIRNEKGFLYPLTLCFLLLFTTVLFLSMEHFLNMKKMTKETENILKMDTYLLRTVQLLEETFTVGEELFEPTGTIVFTEVQAEYSIVKLTESVWDITIFMKKDGMTVFKAHAYYDDDLQRIYKWIEM